MQKEDNSDFIGLRYTNIIIIRGEQGLTCLAWKKIILIFLRLKIIIIIIFGIGIMGLCTGEDNSVFLGLRYLFYFILGMKNYAALGIDMIFMIFSYAWEHRTHYSLTIDCRIFFCCTVRVINFRYIMEFLLVPVPCSFLISSSVKRLKLLLETSS